MRLQPAHADAIALAAALVSACTLVRPQEPFCRFNDSFAFDTEPGASDVCNTRRDDDQHPATCVDRCDARVFCKSLGKRLCGELHGGSLPYGGDTAQGEWFEACSKGGARSHPTGEFDARLCNGDGDATVPVGDDATMACEGGYFGLQVLALLALALLREVGLQSEPP